MREIKFRAWDKERKIIVDCRTWAVGQLTESINVDVMQFTGLKDKNGTEIYEGDIFNCIYHRDGHTDHKYYVIYNELWTCFDYQRIGNPCSQNEVNQSVRDGARNEVIGNIYENPELLKGNSND